MNSVIPNTISLTDIRKSKLPNKITSPIFLLDRGKTKAVILDPEKFAEIMEVYQDYLDGLDAVNVLNNSESSDFTEFDPKDYV